MKCIWIHLHETRVFCSKHVESESAGGGSTAVCSRLCLLLASMSIFSGQEVVTQFLATALHFGGINQVSLSYQKLLQAVKNSMSVVT